MPTLLTRAPLPAESDANALRRLTRAPSGRSREVAHRLAAAMFVGDTLVTFLALCLTFLLRFYSPLGDLAAKAEPSPSDYAGYIVMATVLFVGMLVTSRVYAGRDLLRFRLLTAKIVRCSFAWIALVLLSTFLLRLEPALSRAFLLTAWFVTPAALIAWRGALHVAVGRSSVSVSLRHRVAFVGWNEDTARLAEHLRQDRAAAYGIVGYFETATQRFAVPAILPRLGSVAEFECALGSIPLDIVVLGDPACDREETLHVANVCEREMVEFKVVPTSFQILLSGLSLETIGGTPILGVSRLPLDQVWNRVIKRALDIVGGCFGLLLTMPILAAFGTLVYLESPGPILYRQRRLGRNGKLFDILKIRSMRLDAEQGGKPGWTVQDDPRRLRVGAFMRKWNVDEVPQFWNVLKGEMSLVGPRPERPELIASFKHEIAHYNARHAAKPGITGWAQVNGLRGNTDLGDRIRCDLWYLENWSVVVDFQIMIMTAFKHQNAG